MKLVTVLVNGRVDHIVNFDSANRIADSYVLQNDGGIINLLGFYKESNNSGSQTVIYQTDQGESELMLGGLAIEENEKENNLLDCTLTINLFPSDKHFINESDLAQEIDSKCWDDKRAQIVLNSDASKRYHIKTTFNIVDPESKKVFSRTITLYVIPEKYIHDIVLDYGSEASQLLVYSRKDGKQITINNNAPLFNLFSSALGKIPQTFNGVDWWKEAKEYLQKDDDSGNFFKTSFFAKRKPSGKLDPCIAIKDNVNVNFLTEVGQVDALKHEYITIPNLKVAGHGGVVAPTVLIDNIPKDLLKYSDRYYYRSIINSFIQQAIRYIKDGDTPAYLNVFLLMPNIYTQEDISRNLLYVRDDVMDMASKIEGFDFIKGLETSSVSESDASFIGYMSQLPPEVKVNMPEGRYLIIDAGKGTTDFSVLQYTTSEDAHHMYNSIFRSGIIGAGNAITYSIFLALLKDIYKREWPETPEDTLKDGISDFVKNHVTSNADESQLCRLTKKLEEYKALYNEGELSADTDYKLKLGLDSFDKLTIEGVINYIDNMIEGRHMVSDKTYVDSMMDTLAYNVAVKLNESYGKDEENKISYIVFAGRGFLMTEFKKRMLSTLRTVNKEICGKMEEKSMDPQHHTSASYKNICMYVVGALSSGKYNGRIIGTPQVITRSNPDEPYYPTNEEKEEKRNAFFTRMSAIGKDIINILIPSGGIDYEGLSLQNADELNKELVRGFKGRVRTVGDQIVFSGVAFSVPANIHIGDIEIFFDGYEFVIRQEGNSAIQHFESIVNLDAEHIFESTFPYCQVESQRTIPFPAEPMIQHEEEKEDEEVKEDERPDDSPKDPEQDADNSGNDTENYGSEDEDLLRQLQQN